MTLTVKNLKANYGSSQVLFGIDMTVGSGQIVTLLGRNGMGKTTTVNAIMGMIQSKSGHIEFYGQDISSSESFSVARLGIGLVPEGRRIFSNLTVKENLVAIASNRLGAADPWSVEKVIEIFPNLGKRLNNAGWQLSGGEQQMLAIGRALMTNPRLLVLDEATEGLAPIVREEIWRCLSTLKALKQSILLIDKNVEKLIRIADHNIILEKGCVVWEGSSDRLMTDRAIANRYLGI